jgi:hypothetical protein
MSTRLTPIELSPRNIGLAERFTNEVNIGNSLSTIFDFSIIS